MRRNFTFKRRKSHKLFLSVFIFAVILSIFAIKYTKASIVEQKTRVMMTCQIVYSVPEEEIKLEFAEGEPIPKEYGVIRRCESQEIVCYYIGGAKNIFCQFKRFDTIRSKGNLKPN